MVVSRFDILNVLIWLDIGLLGAWSQADVLAGGRVGVVECNGAEHKAGTL